MNTIRPYAVIMAGGSGTRFWPQSRQQRPKQLLPIAGRRTMIRATVERLLPLIGFDRIMVVTGAAYAEQIRAELPELDRRMVVAEPRGRNTAPCIALAAYKIAKVSPEAVMAVLPADHVIANVQAFRDSLEQAFQVAVAKDCLVTFGIAPDRAETGYGYIEQGNRIPEFTSGQLFVVKSFKEKPDRATAEKYLAAGNFLWNSGMFVWKASTIIRAFETYLPAISHTIESVVPALNTEKELDAIRQIYETVDSISVDYGIMEKAKNVVVIRADIAWNDVGSWASLADVWETDPDGNAVEGEVLCFGSKDCVASSPRKVTVLLGVEDLVVIDTPDAILVCRRSNCQDVKDLQELLSKHGYKHLL
jgi:mannose-1-phosphate guanylyltransferase